jgi:hypothetical protein
MDKFRLAATQIWREFLEANIEQNGLETRERWRILRGSSCAVICSDAISVLNHQERKIEMTRFVKWHIHQLSQFTKVSTFTLSIPFGCLVRGRGSFQSYSFGALADR